MTKPVDYLRLADAEVQAARRWYARRGGAWLVARFAAALSDAEARVSANPSLWSPDQYGTRACRLKKFPYRLIYVEEPARVLVLAVAHDRRRPGYWVRRLPP
ncbi:MAG: type II toxin-antitoxin system RelE/ParE family toxin [Gemmataceae bacterium]|nr:type II toxin-antitoxin system RelE/ParE family toxin [Gemmataceae bacterium]